MSNEQQYLEEGKAWAVKLVQRDDLRFDALVQGHAHGREIGGDERDRLRGEVRKLRAVQEEAERHAQVAIDGRAQNVKEWHEEIMKEESRARHGFGTGGRAWAAPG